MHYYLWIDGKEEGPIDEDDFLERWSNGRLPTGALARSENSEKFSTPEDVRASIAELRFSRIQSVKISDPTPPVVRDANPRLEPCPACDRLVSCRAVSCPNCGNPINPVTVVPTKSRGIYVILGIFFGLLGIHNFYAGRFLQGAIQAVLVIVTGILIVPAVLVLIWVIVELFVVRTDGAGRPLT